MIPDPHHFCVQYAQFLIAALLAITGVSIVLAFLSAWIQARGVSQQQQRNVPIHSGQQRGCLASFNRVAR